MAAGRRQRVCAHLPLLCSPRDATGRAKRNPNPRFLGRLPVPSPSLSLTEIFPSLEGEKWRKSQKEKVGEEK